MYIFLTLRNLKKGVTLVTPLVLFRVSDTQTTCPFLFFIAMNLKHNSFHPL
jgi:hypothetical protein